MIMANSRTRKRNERKRRKSAEDRITRQTVSLTARKEQCPEAAWKWLVDDTKDRVRKLKRMYARENVLIAERVFGNQSATELDAFISKLFHKEMQAKKPIYFSTGE